MKFKIWSSVVAVTVFTALTMVATIPSAVAQTYTVIHNFTGGQDGEQPVTGLTIDRAGNLYGTAELGGAGGVGTVFKLNRSGTGWTFSTLYSFLGGSDGSEPAGEVVIGPNGSIYGTTVSGGGSGCGGYGCGTVFNLLPPAGVCKTVLCPWTERQLYRFAGGNDGYAPLAVVFDGDVMYGPTSGGGGSGCGGSGCGTVFKVDSSGNETVLHRFDNTDGANPVEGRLTSDGAGFFYGTATFGGASCSVEPYFGCGTVFKMDAAGNLTVLHDFSGPPDGAVPSGYLIRDAAGNLYGGAGGGSGPCYYVDMHGHRHYFGCGTIYKIDTAGQETVFYNFRSIPDGRDPVGDLVADSAGNLYGATTTGGSTTCGPHGCGTIFKLDTTGHETVLHTFAGTDGDYPFAGLALDSNGNLYGTTHAGGTYNFGVVFEITP